MKSFTLFLLITLIPCTVLADCIITDYTDKFQVVCSGYDPTAPTIKKGAKALNKMRKYKTVSIAEKNIVSAVGMTEEELQFMQARNRMDGYRGKPKSRVKTAKNQPQSRY